MKKTLVLTILDGFGLTSQSGNAIQEANTPNLDSLFLNNPVTKISASGYDVGLPDGQMGNSEVGHTNIGAGRIVYQDLTRITKSIKEKSFFENPVLVSMIENAIKKNSNLHVIGLLSDGGVHSSIDHLYAILELAKKRGLSKVFVHAILDGRDTSPISGKQFICECEQKMKEVGVGSIVTVVGRYFAMDRDNRWERVEKAYMAIANAEGNEVSSAKSAVEESYKNGITDEFIEPTIINGHPLVKEDDSVIFFNFRPDRARELTRAFVDPNFKEFDRKLIDPLCYVCMTQFDVTIPNVGVAFKPETLDDTFGEYISKKGLTQLRIAETEKYAHVTFFFNGGVEPPYEGEERILVSSPKVATYDLKPEMSAYEVTDLATKRIRSGELDVIILNFANCDMVGHTGNFEATKKAVEAVDTCVKKIHEAVTEIDGCLIITADHGNAEKMFDADGGPFTAHTTNLVPFCVVGYDCDLKDNGRLSDIAPTMLQILNIPQPEPMKGESLIK